MTDFLDRLARRTLGQQSLAQPTIPTLFTPSAVGEAIDAGPLTVSSDSMSSREVIIEDQARWSTLPAPIEAPAVDRAGAHAAPHTREAGIPTLSRHADLSSENSTLPQVPMPEPDGIHDSQPVLTVPGGIRPVQRGTPSIEIVQSQDVILPRRKQIPPPAGSVPRGAGEADPSDAVELDATTKPEAPAPKLTLAIQTPSRSFAQPLVKTIPTVLGADDSDIAHKPAIPTSHRTARPPLIRVTVGRIDVRAILAATATAKPIANKAPVGGLTLDEYIKQRQEGKR